MFLNRVAPPTWLWSCTPTTWSIIEIFTESIYALYQFAKQFIWCTTIRKDVTTQTTESVHLTKLIHYKNKIRFRANPIVQHYLALWRMQNVSRTYLHYCSSLRRKTSSVQSNSHHFLSEQISILLFAHEDNATFISMSATKLKWTDESRKPWRTTLHIVNPAEILPETRILFRLLTGRS